MNMQQDEMIATLVRYKGELEGILSRFEKTHDGIHIDQKDDARFRTLVLELRDLFDDAFVDGQRHSNPIVSYFNGSIDNYIGSPSYHGVECVKSVVDSALTRVQRTPLVLKKAALEAKSNGAKNPEVVVMLAERFHAVARQLRERREGRHTLDVTDEYDVQDLVHALLTIHFDDIRKEEWTPCYAGGVARMDFLLPETETVVETKMTRPNLSTKQLGEQLIVDIAKYKQHPACRTLFCLVYDPAGRISNPRGVENDLKEDNDQMVVNVMIVPQ
jgi:REase_DpnII-MboI